MASPLLRYQLNMKLNSIKRKPMMRREKKNLHLKPQSQQKTILNHYTCPLLEALMLWPRQSISPMVATITACTRITSTTLN